jgi:putative peptidoglycan lipid II flippase
MQSVNRRIFAVAVTVGILNGIVMAVAVLRDLIFAYRFGTGEIIDAFLMGLLVPTMAVQLIGASLSLAIVPEMVRLKGEPDRAKIGEFSSAAVGIGLGVLLLTMVALLLLRQPFMTVLTAGFDEKRTHLTSFFFLGLLPCIVVQGWSTILGGLLNANHRFAAVALAPMLRPLILCITLVFDWGTITAEALLGAYLVGAGAEAVWVTAAAAHAKISIRPRWNGLTEPLLRVLRESAMVVVSTGILSAAILADQYFASLAGPGSVAAYGYGAKITSVLIGVGALPLGVAVLPHFASQVREGDWKQLRAVLVHWSLIISALSIPAAALLWFFSLDLVRLIFQRGAFSSADAHLVATIQMYLALQLPFYLCGILYVRALISLQCNALVALVALTNAVINVSGSLLLVNSIGVSGIALAASCGYAFSTILAGWFVFSLLHRKRMQAAPVGIDVRAV